jgi:hypothetical protein
VLCVTAELIEIVQYSSVNARILIMDYRDEFLSYEDLVELGIVRDLFLGPAKDMTSEAPVPNPLNPRKLTGGTAFERCGQRAVKETGRCYSLTMTHQRQRALVGPTSSGKFYNTSEDANDEYSLNLEIREKVTEVRKTEIDFPTVLTFFLFFFFPDKRSRSHDGSEDRCTKGLYAAASGTCGHSKLASGWSG